MSKMMPSFAVAFVLLVGSSAWAKADCPANVTSAALKSHPTAKVTSCKQEKQKGKVQYEVVLESADAKKLELDLTPDGVVLLTEEAVPVESLPKGVMSGFAAKYPKAKAERAEKQTKADGAVSYEVAFHDNGKKHEATFAEDGKFVEEE
ncbi:MAG: hypothetical protein JWN44_1843 [Myxococcales bacterium]|nr:hypothetical protein [Myxococcales bacterium]